MRFHVATATLSLAVLVALPLLSACNFLGVRANPRVAKITRESDTSRSSTSFDYDDDGRLVEVEDDFEILELQWDDGQLIELTRKDPDGDSEDRTSDLEYEKGRLVEIKGESDDVTTVDYDNAGRIEKVEQEQFDGDFVFTQLFEYDDGGRVVEMLNKSVSDFEDELVRHETKMELEYDEGRLVKLSASSDTQDIEIEMEYEDGRLAKLDFSSVFEDEGGEVESNGTIEYEYDDDGLIVAAEFDSDDGSADGSGGSSGTFEIDYDDGEAVDLDVTPTSSLFFVPFFDLRGNAYSSFDVRTQAPRIAGVSW